MSEPAPSPVDPRGNGTHADELEEARQRVKRMRGDEDSFFSKAVGSWNDWRATIADRSEDIQADIRKGRQKLAEKQQIGLKDEMPDVLAPPKADASSIAFRAIAGLNTTFPFVGILAGISTYELMKAEKAAFDTDILTRGCFRGVIRWLPLGIGASLFYVIEYPLRPYASSVSNVLPWHSSTRSTPLPANTTRNAMPSLHAPTSVSADESANPATWASKAGAGFLAGVAVLTPLYALRAAGVGSLPAVAGLSAACTVGGAFMPNIEKLERMF